MQPKESIGIEWRTDSLRAVKLRRGLGGARWVAAVNLPRDGESPLGEGLVAGLGPVKGPVVLGLPGAQGFVRRLTIPAEDPALLRRILDFQLDRHIPLPTEKVAFDFARLGRKEGALWDLLLVATPKQILETAVESLRSVGIPPTSATLTPVAVASLAGLSGAPPGPGLLVEVASGLLRGEVLDSGRSMWRGERPCAGTSDHALAQNLSAVGGEARRVSPIAWALWMGEGVREPFEKWAGEVKLRVLDPFRVLRGARGQAAPIYTGAVALALQGLGLGARRLDLLNPTALPSKRALRLRNAAAIALGLAVIGAGWWLNAYRLERSALARHLAEIRRLAPEVQALEAEAREIADTRRLIEGLEAARREPSKLVLLRELTLLIPRHTWLTRITYKRGEMEIAGYSSSPQEVIPRLESSALFQQATFAGSIEREGAQERFTIRARLK